MTFRCQGRAAATTSGFGGRPPPHWGKPAAVIDPMPVPGSPLPLLRVPLICPGHLSIAPVLVSFSVNLADVSETGPPGWTVHVAAARTGVAPRTAARAAAGTAIMRRAYRIATGHLPPQAGPRTWSRCSPDCSQRGTRSRASQAGPPGQGPGRVTYR